MAQKLIRKADALIYYPLDIPRVVRKMIEQVNPSVFVLVETELWPNFLHLCARRGIKTLLANGRISPRSYRRYYRTRFFWKRVLQDLDAARMISEIDARRIKDIGMDPPKVGILGNAKYDGLASAVSPLIHREIAQRLHVQEGERFLVAGSTHEGEEKIVIEVYRKLLSRFPEFKLIIVPRHIERTAAVVQLLRRENFSDILTLSEIDSGRQRCGERVTVVDIIGELFKVYALADVVYCGGSLVPKGGQNILEAAAWGKVIFYGPSMEDFSRERIMLEEAGCGNTVRDGAELLQKSSRFWKIRRNSGNAVNGEKKWFWPTSVRPPDTRNGSANIFRGYFMLKKYEQLSEKVNLTGTYLARNVIYRYLDKTRLTHYAELSRVLGCQAFVKHENHNPTGSFKIRGALNFFIMFPARSSRPEFSWRPGAITDWPWRGRDSGFMFPARWLCRKATIPKLTGRWKAMVRN